MGLLPHIPAPDAVVYLCAVRQVCPVRFVSVTLSPTTSLWSEWHAHSRGELPVTKQAPSWEKIDSVAL